MNEIDLLQYEGDPYEDFTLTAQQLHDVMACRRKKTLDPDSKQQLQTKFPAKDLLDLLDGPVSSTMKRNPGLIREEAAEMTREFGFI